MNPKHLQKYTYGYDINSRSYVVGWETPSGTVINCVAWFAEASEAKAKADELNADLLTPTAIEGA